MSSLVGAWRKFAPDDSRSDAETKELQAKWKAAHPRIVKFWHDLERSAVNARDQLDLAGSLCGVA